MKGSTCQKSEFQIIPPFVCQNMKNETKFFPVDSDKMRNNGFIHRLRNEDFLLFKKKHLNTQLILLDINLSSTTKRKPTNHITWC